jgi:hypothetical protein
MTPPTCPKCGRAVRRRPVELPDGRTAHDDCPWRPQLNADAAHDPERKPTSYAAC